MKAIRISLFIFLLIKNLQAQTYRITGKVTNTEGTALLDAAIYIVGDSMHYSALTNNHGVFTMNKIRPGNYMLEVTHIGYKKNAPFSLKINQDIDSIKVLLLDSTVEKEAVTVRTRKRLVDIKGDKLVYHPDMLPGINSDNALELLKKLPGFWVEADNGIHLSGSGTVTVLLNGLKQTLMASQVPNLLKSIPAAQLERIEVTTGGSFKFDGSYGTVVNIILKNRDTKGFNVTVTNSMDLNSYISNSHNVYFAYMSGKLTMNTSIDYSRGYSYYKKSGETSLADQEVNTRFYQYQGDARSVKRSPSIIHSMSWDIGNKSTLNLNLSANLSRTKGHYEETRLLNSAPQKNQYFYNQQLTKKRMSAATLSYRLQMDTLGSHLSAVYGVLLGDIRPKMDYYNVNGLQQSEQASEAGGAEDLYDVIYMRGRNDLNGHQHIFKLDMEKHLNKNLVFSLGGKYTIGALSSDARYDTITANHQTKIDTSRILSSDYGEDLGALYIGMQYQMGRFGIMGGLRMEHTAVHFNGAKLNTYNNYLPNLVLSYKQKNIASLLKLTSTLSRPSYIYLNTAKFYINDFKYRQGNAELKPSRQYRISLENNLFDFLDLTLGYIRIQDQILTVGVQKNNTPYIVLTPMNAVHVNDLYVTASIYYNLLSSIIQGHVSGYGEAYRYIIPDQWQTANITGTQKYGTLSWVNQVKLTQKLKMETSAFIRSDANFYQVFQKRRWQADLGLEYHLNEHLDLSLKYYDLFETYRYENTYFYDQYKEHFQNDPNMNKLRFSVVFRINAGEKKVSRLKRLMDQENATRFD